MDRRRYFISLLFRMSLVVLALMLAVRASYVFEGSLKAWCLAGLFGLSAAARSSFAVILSDTGRKTEAIEELRKAIAAQPSADEAHQMLGRLLFEAGERRVVSGIGDLMLGMNAVYSRYRARFQ